MEVPHTECLNAYIRIMSQVYPYLIFSSVIQDNHDIIQLLQRRMI